MDMRVPTCGILVTHMHVLGECSVLGDMMATEKDWEEVADEEVSNAMRNLNKWQDQMNNVERVFRKYENMAIKHNFPEVKKEAVQEVKPRNT